MNDDTAVREMLYDLTLGQPDPPVDRMTGVRRRHVRRRIAMTSAAAAAAAIALVSAVLVAGAVTAGKTTPANRPVPSWALPWPDHRNGSVPQAVLDRAVSDWQHLNDETKPDQVIWYVGQTAVDGNWVVAIFEAENSSGRHLVVAQALANEVMHGEPAFSATEGSRWVIREAPAPDVTRPPALIGTNLSGVAEPGITNWILVLTRPQESGFRWEAPGTPGGNARLNDGLAIVDTGLVRGEVMVTFDRAAGEDGQAQSFPVALPGNRDSHNPQLQAARKVDTHGRHLIAGIGAVGSGGDNFGLGHSHATVTISARCYGQGAMHLKLDDGPFAVTVPCDNQQHDYSGVQLSPQHGGHMLFITASRLAAYNIAVVR